MSQEEENTIQMFNLYQQVLMLILTISTHSMKQKPMYKKYIRILINTIG
ncbi:unnamed protein product [Paramecium sonneborni]|uniref:Uncharacterized protein n=1 Tax=Paramecium sonneborni TaxID=65129 RepID=A0A8S1KAB4_9CILI|nr:unnamed protein product [Paramecium sonneborni]